MRMLLLSAALCALVTGCRGEAGDRAPVPEPRPGTPPQETPPQAAQPGTAQPGAVQPPQPGAAGMAQGLPASAAPAGDAIVCRPGADVEETAVRLVDLADANGDGKVSRDEAQSLANFVLGGFFFRADTNGDGTVTPEEGRQARQDVLTQHPAIASLLRSVRDATGKSPFATVARLVDVEYGKPLTLAEARDAARTSVNDLFGLMDANKDGAITLPEARNAAWEGTRALGRAAFQAADKDNDERLSQEELQSAVQSSVKVAFSMADKDNNGQLTEDEATAAMGQLNRLVGIQMPSSQQPPPGQKAPSGK